MSKVAYTVIVTLPDERMAGEFVDWLRGGHVAAVLAGGAESASIVMVDGVGAASERRVEVRYVFPNRPALERYLERVSPGLRAEGLRRFPVEQGVRYERTLGEIVGP